MRFAGFVGRQVELSHLQLMLNSIAPASLQVAFLAGEPGVGKTRLLGELARRLREQSIPVLQGIASEAEGMPPYLSFVQALGSYIRKAAPEQVRQAVGAAAPILAQLLPELQPYLAERPWYGPLPPEQSRLRLYEAVGDFLTAIAQTGAPQTESAPLALLLDDLQWADRSSLDLLVFLAQHPGAARVLVVGAYRPGDAAQNPAFNHAVAELTRLRVLTTLTLAPLNYAELAELAGQLLAGQGQGSAGAVDAGLYPLLYAQSEGNPFLAEELLQDWQASGVLVSENGV